MIFFRKKKKKNKASVGGFFKDKFVGDFDLSDAGSKFTSFVKRKLKESVEEVSSSREKLKDLPGTNYNLGVYHMQQGNFYDAIFRFGIVCRFSSDNIDAHYNLGRCFLFKGSVKDAKKKFEYVLKKVPNHIEANYFIKKIDSPDSVSFIPESIIKETVDIRANYYKQDFIENGYMGSKALINEFFKKVEDKNPNYDVLDLGCGTGVCGLVLKKRGLAKSVTGVDLSKDMIQLCSIRVINNEKVYDNLHEEEIYKYLKSEKSKYDLVLSDLATDFIGKLDDYVLSVKNVLKKGGHYAAIVRCEDDLEKGYKLNPDYEDFSYTKKYFTDSFKKVGFSLVSSKQTDMVGDEKVEMLIFKC